MMKNLVTLAVSVFLFGCGGHITRSASDSFDESSVTSTIQDTDLDTIYDSNEPEESYDAQFGCAKPSYLRVVDPVTKQTSYVLIPTLCNQFYMYTGDPPPDLKGARE